MQVRSLVRELRFHLPRGPKHKTNNIVTNSIKTFKMGHTKKVIHGEFPGCQVVKTLCLYCRGQNFPDIEEEGERNIPGHRDSTCEAQSRSGGPEQASCKQELGLTRDPLAEGVRQDQAGDGQTELGRGERLPFLLRKEHLEEREWGMEREPANLCICPGWTEVTSPGDGWRGGGGGPVRAGEGDGVYFRSIELEPTPPSQRRSPGGLQGLDWFCVLPLQKESCL